MLIPASMVPTHMLMQWPLTAATISRLMFFGAIMQTFIECIVCTDVL